MTEARSAVETAVNEVNAYFGSGCDSMYICFPTFMGSEKANGCMYDPCPGGARSVYGVRFFDLLVCVRVLIKVTLLPSKCLSGARDISLFVLWRQITFPVLLKCRR